MAEVAFTQSSVVDIVESGKARFPVFISKIIETSFTVMVETFDFPSPNATGVESHIVYSIDHNIVLYLQLA